MASSYDRRSSSSASRPREGAGEREGGRARAEARASVRPASDPRLVRSYNRQLRMVVCGIAAVLLAFAVYVVVVYSSLFEIERITCSDTEHVTSDTIRELASVPNGSTLFNVDEKGVSERLAANPWIASVELKRVFPDELVINVQERVPAAVVMLSNGSEAWLISTDGVWLEPVELAAADPDNGVEAPADQARAYAAEQGLVYVSDVAANVKPEAGAACDNDAVCGVVTYLEEFSGALRPQIAAAKASTVESISVVLASGIEVSLGTPENVNLKERVVLELLQEYAGQITYINVRVPTMPTWRGLSADQAGDPVDASTADVVDWGASTMGGGADAGDAGTDGGDDWSDDGSWGGELVGGDEGGPGGSLDEGGYYSDSGTWVYYYHDAAGNLIYGYYADDGSWVSLA